MFKTKSSAHLLKRFITCSGSASMGVFTMFGTRKENFDILGLSRSPRNKFLKPFESKYKYCTFLNELLRKSSFHS